MPIVSLQLFREERTAYEFLCEGMLSCKEIQFTIDETRREADATSELFKVLTTDGMGIRELHPLAEQSFVECKDSRV